MINENVVNGLTNATRTSDIFAYLIDSTTAVVYTFLFNPESKSFSREAKYVESVTALTSTPSQQYFYTSGLTLQLSNLLLESYNRNKTCKSLLQGLQSLMVANPIEGKYTPTPVTFKWGVDSFGPAVITNIDWVETSWLNGEVASARVNLTLLEIPDASNQPTNTVPRNLPNKVLTDRQKADASSKAKSWLNSNINKLTDNVAALVRTNNYKLITYGDGVVVMVDSKNVVVGIIGRYVDGKLYTNNNTVTKSRQ
jgi:hypothetical protein